MSDWKKGAAKRRDARHTKTEIRPPSVSTKDTKKWCNGKIGREHKLKCFKKPWLTIKPMYVLACSVCGREFDHWWPPPDRHIGWIRRPKPDWVVE